MFLFYIFGLMCASIGTSLLMGNIGSGFLVFGIGIVVTGIFISLIGYLDDAEIPNAFELFMKELKELFK